MNFANGLEPLRFRPARNESGPSTALHDIRRSRTFIRPVRIIDLGFEFGGLFDQARGDIRVRDCPGEFEKGRCLKRQILLAHHYRRLRFGCPQTLRCSAGIVPTAVLRSALLIFVPLFRASCLRHFGFPFAPGTNASR